MEENKKNDNPNLIYIKNMVTEIMGEDLWNGFCDIVTKETPRVDMYDTGEGFLVLGEIPGIISPEDISISVYANILNIKGISKDKYHGHWPGRLLKSECLYGAFDRNIDLPCPVDPKTISATYENGMLEITMQKVTFDNGKSVKVEFKK